MTKEGSHTDTDGVADPLVSRTYRESAEERTPPELDRTVLRQARRNAHSQYSRSVMWLRPMAWAATIALCLAIVVEVAYLPQLEPDMMPASALSDDVTELKSELDELEELEAPKKADEDVRPEELRQEPEVLEQRARKTIDEDGRVNLQSVPQLSKTAPEEAINMPASAVAPARAADADIAAKRQVTDTFGFADTGSFERNDSPIIEEADAMARMREGKNKESDDKASYVSSASSLGLVAAEAVSAPCDEEVQADPESWLECIEELENGGLDDLARLQREQLQEAFPDFKLP
jgi:hypothetical protein